LTNAPTRFGARRRHLRKVPSQLFNVLNGEYEQLLFENIIPWTSQLVKNKLVGQFLLNTSQFPQHISVILHYQTTNKPSNCLLLHISIPSYNHRHSSTVTTT